MLYGLPDVKSQVSGSFEYPHFFKCMLPLDRPTCVGNRLSAFQVIQRFSVPDGRCSSARGKEIEPNSTLVLSAAGERGTDEGHLASTNRRQEPPVAATSEITR